ncbi:hypothetical protein KKF32_02525 [Patescibacteria group bacterium]|nr:hypothetical protein [Patescibacteria group bacterium]
MFNKRTINKIKLLAKDKELRADKNWLKKTLGNLRQFMVENPGVRKRDGKSHYIVEKVNLIQSNARKSRELTLLGLKLKPMPIITSILIIAILAGGGVTTVQAQDALPGETLYPVKLVTEKAQLVFSGEEGDVKLHAKFALRRAKELESLTYQIKPTETDVELIETTATKLKEETEFSETGLTKLVQRNKDITRLALRVEEVTNNHLQILEGLTQKVPVQALSTIKKAQEASQKGQITAMEAIIKAGEKGYSQEIKPLIEERVKVRLKQTQGKAEIIKGNIKFSQGEEALEEDKTRVSGEPIPFAPSARVKQADMLIRELETSLEKEDLSKALEEIKNINVIFNELETVLPGTSSEDDSERETNVIPTEEVIIVQQDRSGLLAAECADKSYITERADYIIEGFVEKVTNETAYPFMWREGQNYNFIYTDLLIERYIKGIPFGTNRLQIVTPDGVEDQPIFHQGKRVRIYFQGTNGEYTIVCGSFGIQELIPYGDDGIDVSTNIQPGE